MKKKIDFFYLFVLLAVIIFAIGLILGPLFEAPWVYNCFGIISIVIALYGLVKYGK